MSMKKIILLELEICTKILSILSICTKIICTGSNKVKETKNSLNLPAHFPLIGSKRYFNEQFTVLSLIQFLPDPFLKKRKEE